MNKIFFFNLSDCPSRSFLSVCGGIWRTPCVAGGVPCPNRCCTSIGSGNHSHPNLPWVPTYQRTCHRPRSNLKTYHFYWSQLLQNNSAFRIHNESDWLATRRRIKLYPNLITRPLFLPLIFVFRPFLLQKCRSTLVSINNNAISGINFSTRKATYSERLNKRMMTAQNH